MEDLLTELDGSRYPNMTVYSFYCLGAQDSQYSPNMTKRDKENLETMRDILTKNPALGKKKIGEVLKI